MIPMTIFAEISDKTPSTPGTFLLAASATLICTGLAWTNRTACRVLLVITTLIGCLLAYLAIDDAFLSSETSFREAIWSELGWPWVVGQILSPLLPAVGVGSMLMIWRRVDPSR